MKQVSNKNRTLVSKSQKKKRTSFKTKKTVRKTARVHPKFGTSKLEEDFARDFLDKLGVKYSYQYEAKDIGRFYDFAVFLDDSSGLTPGSMLLIEVDGDFYHSHPDLVKEENMNPMQKHNKRVDEYKNKWALMHGIPLIRIWEKDIRNNPKTVMNELKKRLYMETEKKALFEKKNKRHINKIK
jgi:very-short-patch-repair endonuclease